MSNVNFTVRLEKELPNGNVDSKFYALRSFEVSYKNQRVSIILNGLSGEDGADCVVLVNKDDDQESYDAVYIMNGAGKTIYNFDTRRTV